MLAKWDVDRDEGEHCLGVVLAQGNQVEGV